MRQAPTAQELLKFATTLPSRPSRYATNLVDPNEGGWVNPYSVADVQSPAGKPQVRSDLKAKPTGRPGFWSSLGSSIGGIPYISGAIGAGEAQSRPLLLARSFLNKGMGRLSGDYSTTLKGMGQAVQSLGYDPEFNQQQARIRAENRGALGRYFTGGWNRFRNSLRGISF